MGAFIIIIFIFSPLQNLWGHGGKHHNSKANHERSNSLGKSTKDKKIIYKRINQEYLKEIKSIFKKSCFDCHSNQTVFPFYYKIPGIKQYIDSDIKEAKSHLDFSKDFPFISHESPKADLESIARSIKEKTMPPSNYLWLHRNALLNQKEKDIIFKWVKKSLEAIK